ncbi:MAG: AI-2E family transporter [bacterium]|nr:AI-2E family transporter [bacterium]
MRSKSWLFIYFLLGLLVLAYLIRDILTPFILAGLLAYVLNPVVKLLERYLKIHRVVAILLIYLVVFGLVIYTVTWLGGKLLYEISQLQIEVKDINYLSQNAVARLPEWTIAGQSVGFQSAARAVLIGLNTAISHTQDSLLTIFTGALSRVLQVLVFLVATFYFLKDGQHLVRAIKSRFSSHHQEDVERLLGQINNALGGYLRGQIILVFIMSIATSIALVILGVPFALIIGVLTGFLELIPFIGPIAAGGLAATTGYVLGVNRFGLDPMTLAIVIVLIYFVLRQIEDYFVIPQLLGRLTRLHPMVVLFAVLAGGKLAGPIGFILGVPIAASARILLDYFWTKSSD